MQFVDYPEIENLALGDAIDYLRADLIALYLAAEEIHWHLRVKRPRCPGILKQAEVARQLSGNLLGALLRSVCMKEELAGQGECAALLQAVLGLQAENEALAPQEFNP